MKVLDRTIKIGSEPSVFNGGEQFKISLKKKNISTYVDIYELELTSEVPAELPTNMSIQWRLPAHNIKGEWATGHLYDKRIRADWEHPSVNSRVSVNAPIICLFGHQDENIITFACADVINTIELEAPVREEDDFI